MFQKKSLGQNFLRSKKVIADIVAASDVSAGEIVLEVGPGRGILTEALLKTGAKVIAVEKDSRLICTIKEKFSKEIDAGKFELIHADILDFDPALKLTAGNYKLVANIPYYITGQFLRKFLGSKVHPSRMVLLLQKEVAKRIVAADGKESLLSISVKAYGAPRYKGAVKAALFNPPPKVDSAILVIENISKKNFEEIDEVRFFEILRAGFAHKRKFLFGNLKDLLEEKLKERPDFCGIPIKTRAEKVSLNQWLCLVKTINLSR